MAAVPPNPPPIAIPAQPNDPNVQLAAAPAFPPTVVDVLAAVKYHQNVELSICKWIVLLFDIPCNFWISAERPPAVRCTPDDRYNSVLYEHGVVAQAVAAAGPQGTTSQLQCSFTRWLT